MRVFCKFWDEKTEAGQNGAGFRRLLVFYDSTCEKGIAERPQAFRYPEI